MKRAILATTAMISSAFAPIPIVTTPALAANPTNSDAQQVCDALYVNSQADPSQWKAEVVGFHSEDGSSEQVAGSERPKADSYRPDTSSTFIYAGFTHTEDPLVRIGGSPNMWGGMVFTQKIWDNTLYDVEADFQHDVTFYFTCHVSQKVANGNGGGCPDNSGNGNPPVNGNGDGNNGCGVGNGGGTGQPGNNNGNNQQNGGNGDGNSGCGNGNGGPDGTNENCGGGNGNGGTHWEAVDDYDQTLPGDPVDDGYQVIQTDVQLAGHVEGVNYTEYGDYHPSGYYLLSCISPGKKGGTWTAKAWYTGGHCSTATFNAAPTALGHVFDNPPTNSLPAY